MTAVLVGAVVGWAVLSAKPEPVVPTREAPLILAHLIAGDVLYEGASYEWCQERSGFFSPARPDIDFTDTDESTPKCYVWGSGDPFELEEVDPEALVVDPLADPLSR